MHTRIGSFQAGDWVFGVSIDGSMSAQNIGGDFKKFEPYPQIHPVQMAIKIAREERVRQALENAPGAQVDLTGWRSEK